MSNTTSSIKQALSILLDRLSLSMFNALYESSASCLSIFRLLPPIAKQVVMNLLWLDSAEFSALSIGEWIKESAKTAEDHKNLNLVLTSLNRLRIIEPSAIEPSTVVMNETFKRNFRNALTGGGSGESFGHVVDDENIMNLPSIDELDKYAEDTWETILHFMVGSESKATRKPSDTVLALLAKSDLMSSPSQSLRTLRITSKGFQFLLEEVNTQLWDILMEYLEGSSEVVEVLGFLFMLGSLELGRAYSMEHFSDIQRNVLSDLCDYGLIWRPSTKSTYFLPTRLATTLTSDAPPLRSSSSSENLDKGYLIIETNYKVYAYTSNPLQIAVLNLFIHLKSQFPGFVTGDINRKSIKAGLERGITGNQIVAFLASRAHPQMRKSATLLPTTVVDQIKLWEQERQRIQTVDGYLYDDFTSASDYTVVSNYAKELGIVIWELPERRTLFVTHEGHGQLRQFINRFKKA